MSSGLRPVSNPPNPWHATTVELLGPPPEAKLEVYEDHSKSVLSRNDSPDIPFTWSVNPYRGCMHGCAYCYARPGHTWLDMGAGTDFERRIVVKPDAAALLRAALDRRSWKGEVLAFSGVTDCYQPLEASYGLTRACLEVCLAYRNPVGIITRAALIERDLDLLAALHEEAYCAVNVSVPFWDAKRARAIEPLAPSPQRRIATIRRIAEAGVPVGVMVAPIIPGLTDEDIPRILTEAREAGATWAGRILLRLPGQVEAVFVERLRAAFPLRADRVMHQIEACRGGKRNEGRFGARMRGRGPRWQIIEAMIEGHRRRLGYGRRPEPPVPSPFRRPEDDRQGELPW